MTKISPKQQVLQLLDEALATGVRGRVQTILSHAKAEIENRPIHSNDFYANAAADISDPDRPGLVFKVSKQRRRWIYRYTPKGASSTKQITLGYFPEMGVKEAHQSWESYREKLTLESDDKGVMKEMTINQLIVAYIEFAQQHRSDWRGERRLLEKTLGDCLGDKALTEIETTDINFVLKLVEQQGSNRGKHGLRAAGQALSLFRHVFEVARHKTQPKPQAGPWLDPKLANPCEDITVKRPRTLSVPPSFTDLGSYAKSLLKLPINPEIRLLLSLQLELLLPFSTLCRMTWKGIDWENQTAAIESNTSKPMVIVLTESSLNVLKKHHNVSRKSPWVFAALKHKSRPMPVNYASQVTAAVRSHLELSSEFTASSIIQLGTSWLEKQKEGGRLINSLTDINDVPSQLQSEQRRLLTLWQQQLAGFRQAS